MQEQRDSLVRAPYEEAAAVDAAHIGNQCVWCWQQADDRLAKEVLLVTMRLTREKKVKVALTCGVGVLVRWAKASI